MNSFDRLSKALSFEEPDRVPLMLPLTIYGAKMLDMPIQKYLNNPESVVKAQIHMQRTFNNDCVIGYTSAAAEFAAFGGEIRYFQDGPPNSGEPIIKTVESIERLEVPKITEIPELMNILESTRLLKRHFGNSVPILGVLISPFSLPIMQMGFEKYLELVFTRPDLLKKLLRINEAFAIDWGKAQLEAGASGINYIDPMASPTILDHKTYASYGFEIAQRVIRELNALVGMNFASGLSGSIVESIVQTGANLMSFSYKDDPAAMKKIAEKRIGLIGNLNSVDLCNWDESRIRAEVSHLVDVAAPGGGFILSDHHGEIPWQVSEDQLHMLSQAVLDLGRYK